MTQRTRDRLRPHLVRAATAVMRRRWRGLDPDEVSAYLCLVADELDHLHREAATARAEAERAREGLRQWRARHIGCRFADPPTSGPDLGPAPYPGRHTRNRRPVDSIEQDRQPRHRSQ